MHWVVALYLPNTHRNTHNWSFFASASGTYEYGYDPKSSLEALVLRKRAEIEFKKRNFTEVELSALTDAKEALTLAPQYSEAYICQGDAFLALNQFDSVEQSYLASLDIDPSIRHSKSFKDEY